MIFKGNLECYQSKKAKAFDQKEMEKFLNQASDEVLANEYGCWWELGAPVGVTS